MKVQCKNCLPEEGIEMPYFVQSEKKQLWELKLKSPIDCVRHLMNDYKLKLRDAKYITLHINTNYGRCNRCSFDNFDEEYIKCPRCGSLNFNWKLNDGYTNG